MIRTAKTDPVAVRRSPARSGGRVGQGPDTVKAQVQGGPRRATSTDLRAAEALLGCYEQRMGVTVLGVWEEYDDAPCAGTLVP